jgi:hypothetical protein
MPAQGRTQSSIDDQRPDAPGGLVTITQAQDDGRSDATMRLGLQEPRQAGGRRFARWAHRSSSSTLPINRETKGSRKHPDRDTQFEYINANAEAGRGGVNPKRGG